jgi:alpha-galactosidase
LSGCLEALQPKQLEIVQEGTRVYCEIRDRLPCSQPSWPLGLPGWNDDWIASGMLPEDGYALMAVWRRAGVLTLEFAQTEPGSWKRIRVLYPATFEIQLEFTEGILILTLPERP